MKRLRSKLPPAIDAAALLADRAQEVNRAMGAPTPAERAADLSEKRRLAAYARWGSQTPRGRTSVIRLDTATSIRLHDVFGDNTGRALKLAAEWAITHAQEIKALLSSFVAFVCLPFSFGFEICAPKKENYAMHQCTMSVM